jgi:hypothetical protein
MGIPTANVRLNHLRHRHMKGFSFALLLVLSNVAYAKGLVLTQPCVLSYKDLGLGFDGHNTDEVALLIKRTLAPKDAYESLEEYGNRAQRSLKSLPPAIANGSLCVVDPNSSFNTRYDPEKQLLWVGIFSMLTSSWFDGTNLHQDFRIYVREHNRRDSSYIGSNSFGVNKRVTKVDRDATYVAFDSANTTAALGSAIKEDLVSAYLSVPIDVPGAQARALSGNVRVAYQYRLRAPYLGTATSVDLPKIDWPFEKHENQTLVVAELQAVVVFDYKSGKVLKLISLQN